MYDVLIGQNSPESKSFLLPRPDQPFQDQDSVSRQRLKPRPHLLIPKLRPKVVPDNLLVTSLCEGAASTGEFSIVASSVILDALAQAVSTQNTQVPGRVLVRLVALHESLSDPGHFNQFIDFDGFFVKLLDAADPQTRADLAQHWTFHPNPPKQALIRLALDPNPAIARSVIRYASSLSEEDWLTIAQKGQPPHWHALTERSDLPTIVVDFLMIFADSETRQRLKANHNTVWSDPAENLFNPPPRIQQPKSSSDDRRPAPRAAGEKSDKNLDPAPVFPRRDALLLATRLAFHSEQPAPAATKLLPALLTRDLAQDHHARMLSRLALAAGLSPEAVVRGFTAPDLRYFITLLWALDLPQVVIDRLIETKKRLFPIHHPAHLSWLLDHPMPSEQARQALQFFNHAGLSQRSPAADAP